MRRQETEGCCPACMSRAGHTPVKGPAREQRAWVSLKGPGPHRPHPSLGGEFSKSHCPPVTSGCSAGALLPQGQPPSPPSPALAQQGCGDRSLPCCQNNSDGWFLPVTQRLSPTFGSIPTLTAHRSDPLCPPTEATLLSLAANALPLGSARSPLPSPPLPPGAFAKHPSLCGSSLLFMILIGAWAQQVYNPHVYSNGTLIRRLRGYGSPGLYKCFNSHKPTQVFPFTPSVVRT